MSIDDFVLASFEKKCDLVSTASTYMASRLEDDKKIFLYHSGHFFIEVIYALAIKRVIFIRAFNDTNSLLPYAESVSLEEVIL